MTAIPSDWDGMSRYGSGADVLAVKGPSQYTGATPGLVPGRWPGTQALYIGSVFFYEIRATPLSAATRGCNLQSNNGTGLSYFLAVDPTSGATAFCITWNGTTGVITLYQGRYDTGTVIYTSGTNAFVPGQYAFYDIDFSIGASGHVALYQEGVSLFSQTFNTQNGGSGTVAQFTYLYLNICDSYWSTSGIVGPGRAPYIPMAASVSAQFTPSSGTNLSCINGQTQSALSNASSTPGQIDAFTAGTIASGSVILGIRACYEAWKDDSNTRTIKSLVTSGTVTGSGTVETLTSTPTPLADIYSSDPNTGTQWTLTAANAATWKYQEVA